jgi:hypothetical protein
MVVPAIHPSDPFPRKYWINPTEVLWDCEDKSRALLVSEDGKSGWCVKF